MAHKTKNSFGAKKAKTSKRETAQKYALLSVYNKEGVVDLARVLDKSGYRLISTGGTAKALAEGGLTVVPIQEITGNPESFDGRMKTISFQVESGIIFDRTNPKHVGQAKELGIKPIDVVVCNLYPFEETVKDPNVPLEKAVENIDVGGPTMVRAAAKNFKNVLVVVDPDDYQKVTQALEERNVDKELRQALAAKAFAHLSFYDSQIAHFLNKESFPEELNIGGRRIKKLRYGENPHQEAAFYLEPNSDSPLGNLQRFAGRELSLINLTDINAGIESVRLFDVPTAVVIKHNSPCGIALGSSPQEALARAIEADSESAFGGVIVLNQPMTIDTARVIGSFKDEQKGNIDIVAVPEIDPQALELLRTVRKSMGIYSFGRIPDQPINRNIKWITGGFVLQTADTDIEKSFAQWQVVTETRPAEKQLRQMQIAWKFISRIRSNSVIVVDKNLPMTRGIGSGQTSRYRATKIALEQAGSFAKGGVLASDSFFPFDDSVTLAAELGIGAIVQQGGSINDKLSIKKANEAGIPMVFTNRRAFWH